MYKHRYIEEQVRQMASFFKVILVVGARQVGKSTMLKNMFPHLRHITFDQTNLPPEITTDARSYLDRLPTPIIFDEIQFAPQLLNAIKIKVDETEQTGQYFLSGSQNFSMLKSVSESMAGRVGILNLENMSLLEAYDFYKQEHTWLHHYLTNPNDVLKSEHLQERTQSISLVEALYRGNMPRALLSPNTSFLKNYFMAYMNTYINRDIRLIAQPREIGDFTNFIRLCAARTGREINLSHFGREIDITHKTAKNWLQMLYQTYQWFDCPAFSKNATKRLSKRSKGYMPDTGLACYLLRISSPEELADHEMRGPLFETWVFNAIRQQMTALDMEPYLYHWRSANGAEVDVVLSMNGRLYPIEIKAKRSLTLHDTRGLQAFRNTFPHERIQTGLIIYGGTQVYRLSENVIALPWNAVVRK